MQREQGARAPGQPSELERLFGSDWARVRDLMQQQSGAGNCNWKITLQNPTSQIRTALGGGIWSFRSPFGTMPFRVQSIQAASGIKLTRRRRTSCNFSINAATGDVSAGFGNLKINATRNVDFSVSAGPVSVGLNWSLFNPLSSGVTWKVGLEYVSSPVSAGPDYTAQSFYEAEIQGDLSTQGRVALGAAYVVAAVAAGYALAHVGAALLVAAEAVLVPVAAAAVILLLISGGSGSGGSDTSGGGRA